MTTHNGDFEKVVEHVHVHRLIFSEKDRIGIGTFQPKDEKNQDSTELTGDINYRKIAEYGSDSDPRAFNFDGEFNIANRGIIEFIEILKLDVAFLYDLLGATQEHKIKPKKFAQTDIDEVILGHSVAGETPILFRHDGRPGWTTLAGLHDRFAGPGGRVVGVGLGRSAAAPALKRGSRAGGRGHGQGRHAFEKSLRQRSVVLGEQRCHFVGEWRLGLPQPRQPACARLGIEIQGLVEARADPPPVRGIDLARGFVVGWKHVRLCDRSCVAVKPIPRTALQAPCPGRLLPSAALEHQRTHAAGQRLGHQPAQVPRPCTSIQQPLADEADEVVELMPGQAHRHGKQGVDTFPNGLDRPPADAEERRDLRHTSPPQQAGDADKFAHDGLPIIEPVRKSVL